MITDQILFLLLALAGLADTGYLIYRRGERPMICPLGEDCSLVLGSRWANWLGIRNETLGFIFYLIIFILALLGADFSLGLSLLITLGFLYSLFLTGIQIFVIKNFCSYCLLSALINLLLFSSLWA